MYYILDIFINSNLLQKFIQKINFTKIKLKTNTVLIPFLWAKILFLTKNANYFQKNADISKIKGVLVLKGIFSKTKYNCLCKIYLDRGVI